MEEKFSFALVSALIVDCDQYSNEIVTQILRGFGLSQYSVVVDGEEAKRRLVNGHYDLMLCEAKLPDMPAAELVRWVRRLTDQRVRHIPIIGLTGYTEKSIVFEMRDSGVNIVVGKPVAPNVLFDHVVWAAKSTRPFVETDTYVGPCRRFQNIGPPNGLGRRSTDLSAQVGVAVEPNMSQDQIDSLLRPTKIALD